MYLLDMPCMSGSLAQEDGELSVNGTRTVRPATSLVQALISVKVSPAAEAAICCNDRAAGCAHVSEMVGMSPPSASENVPFHPMGTCIPNRKSSRDNQTPDSECPLGISLCHPHKQQHRARQV